MFGKPKIKPVTIYWVKYCVELKNHNSIHGVIDHPTQQFFKTFPEAKKAGDEFNEKIAQQMCEGNRTVVVADCVFKAEDFIWAGYDIEEDEE